MKNEINRQSFLVTLESKFQETIAAPFVLSKNISLNLRNDLRSEFLYSIKQ